jgi:hypothetical protein
MLLADNSKATAGLGASVRHIQKPKNSLFVKRIDFSNFGTERSRQVASGSAAISNTLI